jgi:glycosyltransferase involved in cell wall biosynthesis
LSYEANDWLMKVMRDRSRSRAVTVVHSYEDCSLLQFREAAKSGKARVYDMPIGYYPAWQSTIRGLARRFPDWLPDGHAGESPYVRPEQKLEEMELAQLVLAPSKFVQRTVQDFVDRSVALAPYGVDSAFWSPGLPVAKTGPMRFLFAGACSLRKGVPLLMEAWRKADLRDAVLDLVGSWQLAKRQLPGGVTWRPGVSAADLRECFRSADVLVLPSYFEGFGLVLLEAMACGLPVITTDAAGCDILDGSAGRVLAAGDLEALVEALRWANADRKGMAVMGVAARAKAESMTWHKYRERVRNAVAPLVGRR